MAKEITIMYPGAYRIKYERWNQRGYTKAIQLACILVSFDLSTPSSQKAKAQVRLLRSKGR